MRDTRGTHLIGLTLLFVVFFGCSTSRTAAQEIGQIKPYHLDAVVQIVTPPGPAGGPFTGTGFLVVSDTPGFPFRAYLVTNKHMVSKWECPGDDLTGLYDWLDVYFYRSGDPEGKKFKATRIALKDSNGRQNMKKVFAHQDKMVDVVAIDVMQELLAKDQHITSNSFTPSVMVRFADLEKQLTGLGDLVFALGYPHGISSVTNHPIAKAAYLASVPGEEISIPYSCRRTNGQQNFIPVKGKILIVDGLIQHGNSGSPVLLGGGIKIRHNPATGILEFSNYDIQNLVCGIVSFEVRGPDLMPGTGLFTVYSSDYILDLLDTIPRLMYGANQ